ncbi:MAG: MurR/RpiR family transcriptional regulator [Oscillospiraceae bacterium]
MNIIPKDPSRLYPAPGCLSEIRLKRNQFSKKEKVLADYFLSIDYSKPFTLSIKELASRTSMSVATIVRFCRELGYGGYAEFKYSLSRPDLSTAAGGIIIGGSADISVVKDQVCSFTLENMRKCLTCIEDSTIAQVVEAIHGCGTLLVLGIGTSAGIAYSAANSFMNIGVRASSISDPLTMLRTVSFLEERDVVIGITNCGYIKPTVDALALAKTRGLKTISITSQLDSLVAKYSDYVLDTTLSNSTFGFDSLTITACQLLTIQTLQVAYLARFGEEAEEMVKLSYDLAEMQRYAPTVDEVKQKRVKN